MTSFSIFKKRQGQSNVANVQMTETEAALAQSDFNIEKISEIENKFTGGAVLLVPGRIFIREGLLWKVCRKGPKKRQFFLFNDTLVYGSIVAGRYSNQQILPLSQMSVSAECQYRPVAQAQFDGGGLDEQLDVAHAFQISHASKSFHVFALSAPDKANWLSNLEKHIARVSDKKKEQLATRPVWVPDSHSKECMVCGQKFTAFVRKHHCRSCGRVVCTACSPHRVNLNALERGESKLERACKECFKKMFKPTMTAQVGEEDQSKKDSASPPTVTVGQEETRKDPSSPPPASVAAQLVSNVLRGRSPQSPVVVRTRVESKDQREDEGDSTETEDSDDSGNEKKEASPSTARHTPFRSKSETTRPIKLRNKSPGTKTPERPSSEHLETPSAGKGEESPEAQPTPPPRRKKQQKQKVKELQQQLAAELLATRVPHPPPPQEEGEEHPKAIAGAEGTKEGEEDSKETRVEGEREKEREERGEVERAEETRGLGKEGEDTRHEEVKPDPAPESPPKEDEEIASLPRKPRRRKKHLKPEEVQSSEGAASVNAQARTETTEGTGTGTEQSGTGTEQSGMGTEQSGMGSAEQTEPETKPSDADKGESKVEQSTGGAGKDVDAVGSEAPSQAEKGEAKVVEGGEENKQPHPQGEEPAPEGGGGTETQTAGTPKARPRGRRQKFKTPTT